MVQTVKNQQEKAKLRLVASTLLSKLNLDVSPVDVVFRDSLSSKQGYVWTVEHSAKRPGCLEKKLCEYNAAERSRVLQMLVTGQLKPVLAGAPVVTAAQKKKAKKEAREAEAAAAAAVAAAAKEARKDIVKRHIKRGSIVKIKPIESPKTPVKKDFVFDDDTASESSDLDIPPAYASLDGPLPLPEYRQKQKFDRPRHASCRDIVSKELSKIMEQEANPPKDMTKEIGSKTGGAAVLDNIVRLFKVTADLERTLGDITTETEKSKNALDILHELYATETALIQNHLSNLERRKEEMSRDAELCQMNLNTIIKEFHMA